MAEEKNRPWDEWLKNNPVPVTVHISKPEQREAKPWDLLNPNKDRASEEIQEERLAICRDCPSYRKMLKQCKECGCVMPAKVKLADAFCPLNKWSAISALIEDDQTPFKIVRNLINAHLCEDAKGVISHDEFVKSVDVKIRQYYSNDMQISRVLWNEEIPEITNEDFLVAFVSLNDHTEYEGGELRFPDKGESLKPGMGDVIMFSPKDNHSIAKVTSGSRKDCIIIYSTKKENND
jgi:hypothetical protein